MTNIKFGRANVYLNYTLPYHCTPPKDVKQSSNLEAGVNADCCKVMLTSLLYLTFCVCFPIEYRLASVQG